MLARLAILFVAVSCLGVVRVDPLFFMWYKNNYGILMSKFWQLGSSLYKLLKPQQVIREAALEWNKYNLFNRTT